MDDDSVILNQQLATSCLRVHLPVCPFNDAVSVNPAGATNWDIVAFLRTRHASDFLSLEAGTSYHLP